MRMSSKIQPDITLKQDQQIRLIKLQFINTEGNFFFSLDKSNFNKAETLRLETKVMYFPLLRSSLYSRSSNMLLDEFFELDLQVNSFLFLVNQFRDSSSHFQSKLIFLGFYI